MAAPDGLDVARSRAADHGGAAESRPKAANDSSVRVLASGAKALAAAQIVNQVARFGTNVVLARLLAPRDFGLMAIALVVMMFLEQFRDLGTGVAVIQRRELTQELLNAVFFLNTLLGLVIGLTLLTSASPITRVVSPDGNPDVLRAFAAITFIAAFGQIHNALLRRDLRFRQLAIVNVADALVNGVVSIVLAALGFGVWALVIGALTSTVVNTGAVWYMDPWRPTRRFALGSLRSIAGFSAHLFGINLVGFFFGQSDKILVARYLGAAALGIYGMAVRVLTYPLTSIATVVAEVSFPAFARRQDDHAKLRAGFVRATSVVALVTFPLMAILAAVARPAVDTVFGGKWEGLTPLIWILAPVGAIQSVAGTANQLLMAKGEMALLFRWTLFSSGVNVTAYIVGLHWGLIGLCAGSASAILLLTPLELLLTFRKIELHMTAYIRPLLPTALCSAAGAGAALAVDNAVGRVADAGVVLVTGLITGFGVFVASMLLLQPPAVADVRAALQRKAPKRRGGRHRQPTSTGARRRQPRYDHGDRAVRPGRGRHRTDTGRTRRRNGAPRPDQAGPQTIRDLSVVAASSDQPDSSSA